MITDRGTGRTIEADGQSFLFFSGYAYLGMNQLPSFTELVKEGIDKYGLSFPSSRISNTRLHLFEAMEQLLSSITGQEATVCFASGFTASSQAASLLPPVVLAAPGAHPAVHKGKHTPGSFASWSHTVAQQAETYTSPVGLVADAVNIFTPCLNDFSFLQDCSPDMTLLIDDSHGIGLTGPHGEGVSSRVSPKQSMIISYSLSKAYNLIGGAVSCSAAMADQLRRSPEYTAATSLSPAFIYAFIKGQALYQQQLAGLRRNISLFRTLVQDMPGIASVPELPVFVLPANTNAALLLQQGIVISSFAYPDPAGPALQRAVLNALHTEEDLHRLAQALQQAIPAPVK